MKKNPSKQLKVKKTIHSYTYKQPSGPLCVGHWRAERTDQEEGGMPHPLPSSTGSQRSDFPLTLPASAHIGLPCPLPFSCCCLLHSSCLGLPLVFPFLKPHLDFVQNVFSLSTLCFSSSYWYIWSVFLRVRIFGLTVDIWQYLETFDYHRWSWRFNWPLVGRNQKWCTYCTTDRVLCAGHLSHTPTQKIN